MTNKLDRYNNNTIHAMNKEQLNQKLSDLEEEAANLRSLINGPEQRTPKAGDVWRKGTGYRSNYLMCNASSDGILASNLDSNAVTHFGEASSNPLSGEEFTYLGKFDEVYVKISYVRDALSHKDIDGEGMLDYINQEFKSKAPIYGGDESFKALRKLNIITD